MKIRAVMIRILLQLKHDKRTMALMILAPILVLTMMSFIFNGSDYHPKIGIMNAPLSFVNKLEDHDAKIFRYDENNSYEALKESKVDAIINFESGLPHIELEGSDPAKNNAVIMLVQKVMEQTTRTAPETTYLYGYENMSSFDNFGPILIGFFVFFFVFLISAVSFLGELTSGTLERLLSTPLHRWEIIMGYILGFGVFTVIQSTLIAWYSIHVLKIMMVGSFGLVLLITILTALISLSLGTLVSLFADNELQVIQYVQIILVPQIFFSGLFDLSTMPPWLQTIGHFMPLWYIADALKNIMIRGKGWNDIAINVFILSAICVFLIIANILTLKKYRKI